MSSLMRISVDITSRMNSVENSILSWTLVLRYYTPNDDFFALFMTCTSFHEILKTVEAPMKKPSWKHVLNSLTYLQWARSLNCPWDADTCSEAAKFGHLDTLKWARLKGCPWDQDTCSGAACGGHLHILKWARNLGCPWDEKTCNRAVEGGHLHILKWARRNGCPWDAYMCYHCALNDKIRSWIKNQE